MNRSVNLPGSKCSRIDTRFTHCKLEKVTPPHDRVALDLKHSLVRFCCFAYPFALGIWKVFPGLRGSEYGNLNFEIFPKLKKPEVRAGLPPNFEVVEGCRSLVSRGVGGSAKGIN
jgi:hypothetical protein